MISISALIALMRPVNSIMIGLAVLVGMAVVSPQSALSQSAVFGFLTGFLISSYSMTINDRYDVEIDRINDPRRPIPSGKASITNAMIFASILLLLGLISSAFITVTNIIIASIFALIALSYSLWGKRRGLLGNAMVAASMAVPFVYGGVASGGGGQVLIWSLAFTAFLAGTGREVIKTISDIKGDEARGIRSVAITRGSKNASRIGGAFFIAAIIAALIPLMIGEVGLVYAIMIMVPDGILVYATMKIIRNYSTESAERVKTLVLLGMMTGLIAFIVGGALML